MVRLILLRILESYFRHRWLFLIPLLLSMIIAGAYLALSKPEYIAQGILFVQKESLLTRLSAVKGTDVTWETPASTTAGEINDLIKTDSFLRAIIQQTDLEKNMGEGPEAVRETIENVREAVWTSAIGANQVLVAASTDSPELSYQLANAMVNTYIQWKINADMSESAAAYKFFSELAVRYKTEADTARKNLYDYINQHPTPLKGERPDVETLDIAKLEAALSAAEARQVSVLDKVENSQLAAAQAESTVRQSFVVIDAPLKPEEPSLSRMDIAVQLAIFLAVGVIISGITIGGSALLDRTFRFPVDVWHGIGLKVLTTVPDMTPPSEKKPRARKEKSRVQPIETETESETHVVISELAFDTGADSSGGTWQSAEMGSSLLPTQPIEAEEVITPRKRRQKLSRGSN